MATPSFFSKNQIFTKQIKKRARHRVEAHEQKYGVHKMATPLGTTRGSNLNLRWSKCGVWLVDQWVPISLWASVCLTFDCTLRALNVIGCMVGYCVHLGHWHADYADWLSWLRILMYRFFCASLLYPFGILPCWLCWLIILFVLA